MTYAAQKVEQAGAAGMCIEDKRFPKDSSLFELQGVPAMEENEKRYLPWRSPAGILMGGPGCLAA